MKQLPYPDVLETSMGTTVVAHDAVHQGQAEPGPQAEVLGGEEGIEAS